MRNGVHNPFSPSQYFDIKNYFNKLQKFTTMSEKNVKTVIVTEDEVTNALAAAGIAADVNAFGVPVKTNKKFTITGISVPQKEKAPVDNFKTVLLKTSAGFAVPVAPMLEIEEIGVPIEDNTAASVAKFALQLHKKGTVFVVKRYTKATGKYGTDDYIPSSWRVELAE